MHDSFLCKMFVMTFCVEHRHRKQIDKVKDMTYLQSVVKYRWKLWPGVYRVAVSTV